MSAPIRVGAAERGRVWVFAVDLDREGLAAFTRRNGDWPLRAALGAETLDPDHVEVFTASDLEGIGLARYLEEGHGIAPEELDGLRARLDAERGAVLVLSARALGSDRPAPDGAHWTRSAGADPYGRQAPAEMPSRPGRHEGADRGRLRGRIDATFG